MFSFFKELLRNKDISGQDNYSQVLMLQNNFVKTLLLGIDFDWDKLDIHFEYYPCDENEYFEIYVAHYFKGDVKGQFDPTLDAADALIEIQKEMSKNNKEPWSWVYFTLDNTGKYNFDFNYGVPPIVKDRLERTNS